MMLLGQNTTSLRRLLTKIVTFQDGRHGVLPTFRPAAHFALLGSNDCACITHVWRWLRRRPWLWWVRFFWRGRRPWLCCGPIFWPGRKHWLRLRLWLIFFNR